MPKRSAGNEARDLDAIWLIAATRNPAKIAALNAELPRGIRVRPYPDHVVLPSEIDADDLAEIAMAKAVAASRELGPGELVVATDGGLDVPGLGNEWQPSRTRRFAGEKASNHDRAAELVNLAAALVGSQRTIIWREALALAVHGELVGVWEATSKPGMLIGQVDLDAIQRSGDFWVQGVWRVPDEGGLLLVDLPERVRSRVHCHWAALAMDLNHAVGRSRENRRGTT